MREVYYSSNNQVASLGAHSPPLYHTENLPPRDLGFDVGFATILQFSEYSEGTFV